MIKLTITGARGKMGQTLLQCARETADLQVTGLIDLGDDLRSVIENTDVVIDFSFKDATRQIAELAARHKKPLVIGTTGHDASEQTAISAEQKHIPIVWASNFSTGVNVLFWLTRNAAKILGPGFDPEIVEMHHRHKKDAPSGTAASLARILIEARQEPLEVRHGRQGITGERPAAEIGMHSLRGGDVVGDHTVLFAAPGERLELTHRAYSRETFARGALRAARWVVNQPPGLYDMEDVLGLNELLLSPPEH